MKLDVSRVYTSVNADELKVGSKVIVADTFEALKDAVERDRGTVVTLLGIEAEDCIYRFCTGTTFTFALAYLISEPDKLKWTDLKVGDIIRNGISTRMVIGIESDASDMHILIGGRWVNDEELTEQWEKVEDE